MLSRVAVARPEQADDAIGAESDAETLTPALLYRRHFQDVCRWVSYLMGPGPEVEDLVQEVFVIACRRLDSFRGEAKPSTWLYGIARNVVRNHRRRMKIRKFFLAGDTEDIERAAAREPTPLEEVERREREELVYRVLDGMKEKYRVVLIMFELEELDGKEIAERLQIKEATVWVQLHRARKSFLERMQKLEKR
jgi:RNA polymerase sigma-70 factor, ECF subfamily